ncbi:MAG: SOS response-associated peptidase [Marmoricola sp.]
MLATTWVEGYWSAPTNSSAFTTLTDMCGRYSSSRDAEAIADEFDVQESLASGLEPNYNVAPTDPVYAVLERPAKEDRPQQRQLRRLTWGLVPSWAKDASIGSRLINARLETAAEKPAFRRAFERRRAIIPADGYYEWYAATVEGKTKKQPYFIAPEDGSILAMAGLYEIWRDPSKPEDAEDRFRWSMTIITTTAEDALGHVHDRMPLMLDRDGYDAWLDPTITDVAQVTDLLRPAAPGLLLAVPVSPLVSNVRNNGPELIEPIQLEA